MTEFKYRQLLLSGLTLSLLNTPMAMAAVDSSSLPSAPVAAPSPPSLGLIDSGTFARETNVNLERISLPCQETEAAKFSSSSSSSSNQPTISDKPDKSENTENSEKPVEASASFTEEAPRAIAQSAPQRDSDIVPIDLTPVRLPERTSAFNGLDSFKSQALYKLPGRVFFNASVENSLRFEANTFQTNRHYLSDMVYRVLPNVTLGYALDKKTRVSANYFFLRDQYTLRNNALSRNIHSIGGRIDRDVKINDKTTATFGLMPRVLFINTVNAPSVLFNDLIPSAVITRRVGQSGLIYGSVMGQVRWHGIASGFQEFDQFYSFGGAWRKGPWNFLIDNTLVTNFGNRRLRFGPNNQVIITTLEAGRRLHPRLPITAFIRAEPIYNIGANTTPGYAGFNFRIFGGLRAEIAKPPIFPIKLKHG